MQLKKALNLLFLRFQAKERAPFKKYIVRVLFPCKAHGTCWIPIRYYLVRGHYPGC